MSNTPLLLACSVCSSESTVWRILYTGGDLPSYIKCFNCGTRYSVTVKIRRPLVGPDLPPQATEKENGDA